MFQNYDHWNHVVIAPDARRFKYLLKNSLLFLYSPGNKLPLLLIRFNDLCLL